MMRRFSALAAFFIALSLLLPAPSRADFKKTKIAVLDFQMQGEGYETKDMGAIVAEWFITALVRTGRFDVIERALLKKILEEQKLGLSGVVDADSASRVGKLLGVKTIISGSVMRVEGIVEVNARIIDVESGSIIAAENVRSTSSSSLQDLINQMAGKIIKNFPLEGYVVDRSSDKVSIDLGRLAGVKNGMEFIVYKEGKVIKHPKTGEVLDVEKIETGKIKIVSMSDKIAKGKIVKEHGAKAIAYGQRVKSVAGPLKPIKSAPVYSGAPAVVQAYGGRARRLPPNKVQLAAQIMRKLKSPSSRNKTWAAKKIIRAGLFKPVILDAVEQELLKGYQARPRDRNHVDAMSWLAKVFGAAANPKYKPTLVKVAHGAKNRKLRGYAKKALRSF